MKANDCILKLALLLAFSISTITAAGQDTLQISTDARSFQQFDQEPLTIARAEIRKKQPKIPESVLEEDILLIKSTLPSIMPEFWKLGLTEEDAVQATLRGWKRARLNSPLRFNPEQPMDESSFRMHVLTEQRTALFKWKIHDANPNIKGYILEKDLWLINETQSEIVEAFENSGLEASDAQAASFFAWKEVRLDSPLRPNQKMDRESFITFVVDSTGIITFDSEPDEADVLLGKVKLGKTSKVKEKRLQRTFLKGLKITVTFTKPDFVSQTRDCVAEGREAVSCSVELQRKQ